ncbi:hypothetical protein HETIRDRAFT_460191 [Heterobasidion irregulare TC 32-1]|uniref:Uncharacterized protein n=1 Tax=Heterobasidion irregulare (strain TC 32-1) TaxID=747525 RepID=W4JX63_HETIT|nr:uncharacterized protein HETIRDRAFT_460191 [Heterobasidion irregulare TC 32-1]ETW77670.1 hypothetical protein HETIRDRAFT_460191 [Heterobasidion irregulare TC 32-1]
MHEPLLALAHVRASLRACVPPRPMPALPGDDAVPVPLRQVDGLPPVLPHISLPCAPVLDRRHHARGPLLWPRLRKAARMREPHLCGSMPSRHVSAVRGDQGGAVLVRESGEAACMRGGKEGGVRCSTRRQRGGGGAVGRAV